MDKEVVDNVTGETYSLDHLKSFPVTYGIKVDGNPVDVTVYIHFSEHCYTRSRKDGDPDEAVLIREKKKNGDVDERVFAKSRWEFSKSLPDILKALHGQWCFMGNNKEMFYRQEGKILSNSHGGWYICARFGISHKHQNLTINIRSVHYRENRPHGIRREAKRFFVLLARYYSEKRKNTDWL